ncbi:MAG: type II toxin-antitoxin system RelE/ParE family toxin [Rubrivivax sp.]|nr:MAG: type II toxin-antitoxin system RelE/ParE family toxin [Rubrivivax sp.]
MTRIKLAASALRDLDRIREFLLTHDEPNEPERMQELLAALHVLTYAPEIGRRVSVDRRELVIGRNARGYVAQYRYMRPTDTVLIMAVRHQRESPVRR